MTIDDLFLEGAIAVEEVIHGGGNDVQSALEMFEVLTSGEVLLFALADPESDDGVLWLAGECEGQPVPLLPVFTHLSHVHELFVQAPWAKDAALLVVEGADVLLCLEADDHLILNPWSQCAFQIVPWWPLSQSDAA